MVWLTGYTYRKKITITGQAGAGTNYQVKLQIGNASGGDFNLSGHSLSFPHDIRFKNGTDSTELSYWIENVAISPITVWINVADSLNSNVDIYCYYGKASDTTTSNGTNTFVFFDDATGTFSNKWINITGTSSYAIIGGKSAISLPGDYLIRTSTFSNSGAFIYEGEAYSTYRLTSIKWFQASTPSASSQYHARVDVGCPTCYETIYRDYTIISSSVNAYESANTWVNVKLIHKGSGVFDWWVNNGFVTTGTDTTYTSGYLGILHEGGGSGAATNMRIRKYAATEPAFSIVSAEQTPANITATTMTITKSENPCRTGICTVTVVVRWSNSGGIDGLVTPNITIDTVLQTAHADRNVVTDSYIDETFTLSGLSAGTHSICPSPN